MAKGKGKKKTAPGDVATNRQARHRFTLLDTYEAGIVLRGTEVKALRNGGATLKDAYATVRDGEVWLHHLHIPPYAPAYHDNHEPERDRKLLLHRREIEKLVGTTKERGLTLVPMRLYFKGPKAKVEIALAQGKDRFDKRESIKAREMGRDMQRALRDAERH
ncbi:MAG: SsrA-binding protein [Conexibacter sp.]|jgi:SsrA-binding protein|nr:SsrA-binding protein [Conexibacter sp.]